MSGWAERLATVTGIERDVLLSARENLIAKNNTKQSVEIDFAVSPEILEIEAALTRAAMKGAQLPYSHKSK